MEEGLQRIHFSEVMAGRAVAEFSVFSDDTDSDRWWIRVEAGGYTDVR